MRIQHTNRKPSAYKVLSLLVRSGLNGVDEWMIKEHCYLMNGRNYLTEFERQAGVKLGRRRHKTQTGAHYTQYFIQNQGDAKKVLNRLSGFKAGSHELNEDFILSQYPEAQEVKNEQ